MNSEKKKGSSTRTWYWTAYDLQFNSCKQDGYKGPIGLHTITAGTRCYRAAMSGKTKRYVERYGNKHIPVHLEGMIRYLRKDDLITEEEHDNRLAEARSRKIAGVKALGKKHRGPVDKG